MNTRTTTSDGSIPNARTGWLSFPRCASLPKKHNPLRVCLPVGRLSKERSSEGVQVRKSGGERGASPILDKGGRAVRNASGDRNGSISRGGGNAARSWQFGILPRATSGQGPHTHPPPPPFFPRRAWGLRRWALFLDRPGLPIWVLCASDWAGFMGCCSVSCSVMGVFSSGWCDAQGKVPIRGHGGFWAGEGVVMSWVDFFS